MVHLLLQAGTHAGGEGKKEYSHHNLSELLNLSGTMAELQGPGCYDIQSGVYEHSNACATTGGFSSLKKGFLKNSLLMLCKLPIEPV